MLKEIATAGDDVEPFEAHRRPRIADREDEYRGQRRGAILSPDRGDPFANGGATPAVNSRSYADIIREQQLRKDEADLKKQMKDKAKDGTLKVVEEVPLVKTAPKRRGRWDMTGSAEETPSKVAKKPAVSDGNATPSATPGHGNQWDATPGRKDPGSETPSMTPAARMWDPTPAHTTPGRETPAGGMTPGGRR